MSIHTERKSFPSWLKRTLPQKDHYFSLNELLKKSNINTVCVSARCPNKWECFSRGTATFLVLGTVCSRNCLFCSVTKGNPQKVDIEEPERVAHAVKELKLKHVVLTMVTRDDLADGGAVHLRNIIRAIRNKNNEVTIEVLVSDFLGNTESIMTVLNEKPEVFGHNIEMVSRLYPSLRKNASYSRSLEILRYVSEIKDRSYYVKSGLMVGLGESDEELTGTLRKLRESGVEIVTIGQYLQPEKNCHEVVKYVEPKMFEYYYREAKKIGFAHVYSGPLVRSSYRSEESFLKYSDQVKK
ncbi:MAG: lipoyl synthase [Candidatus Ancaeobacter aquaticus]|nr:lipoyl synthase [Candidatus Ancaeobacter aquaticus]